MLTKLGPHDHAVLVYHSPAELREGLAEFAQRGLAARELIVFVHAFDTKEEAIEFLESSPFDFGSVLDRKFFLLSFYEDAFEGGRGRIDFDHVVQVVDELIRASREQGMAGLGVYVDASRIYLAGDRADEWFEFEERLGRRLHHEMALVCAYPGESIRAPALLERVLITHQYRFGI